MTQKVELILASASPRRRQLLASAGLYPIVKPQDVDESLRDGESPIAYALRTATAKAQACPRSTHQIVLAADTVVAYEGRSLGKPVDDHEAQRMLKLLSGQTHVVHTAIVLLGETMLSDVASTKVRFRVLSDQQIERYIVSGDGRDKAGAYGIQGEGGSLVASLEGSYTNVVGLPLEETLRLLRLLGID